MTMGSPAVLPSSPRKNQATSIRRTNKPLVEKKRRARINGCLGQLKSLLLSAMKTEGTQVSRLEKADILEMTVKYLRHVQCQPQMISPSPSTFLPVSTSSSLSSSSSSSSSTTNAATTTEPEVAAKFSAGYTECATEVIRYMDSVTGMSDEIKMRLENHLVGRIHGSSSSPEASTSSAASTPSSTSSSSPTEHHSNPSHTENNRSCATEIISSNEAVSPRHYQTALDLANMASSIVQQQQKHNQQYLQHQQIQPHPADSAFFPQQQQQPMTCSSVAATPDTPPNTPPHIKMEADCYYDNNDYSNDDTKNFQGNSNTTHTNPSSSPSSASSSPSPSEDGDEMVIDTTGESHRDSPDIKTSTSVSFTGRESHQYSNSKENTHPNIHPTPRILSHNVGNNQLTCQVNTSPINLIRRRLPLSAYATPLHIDIPNSPALSTTPSPPHLLTSKPVQPSVQVKENDFQKRENYSHDCQDNESLPTILYGAHPESLHPSQAPQTYRIPQLHPHQHTHPRSSHTDAGKKTSPGNTCNLDNCENNTKCRSQPIRSTSSLETRDQRNPTAAHPTTHKQTIQPVPHHQGHPYLRIDSTHRAAPAPTPSLPTLTREDTGIKSINPSSPRPHPHTTQKTRHSSCDSLSNIPARGPDTSFQSPYVTQTRKSPPSQIAGDNGKAIDMRNWKGCDRKPETNNVHSNEHANDVKDVINTDGYQRYSCKINSWDTHNFRQPTATFKHPQMQNHPYQEQYPHHQQLQQKQKIVENFRTKQIYDRNIENMNNKNIFMPIARIPTPTTSHIQQQRFSSTINHPHPHPSSQPLSNYQAHNNYHHGGHNFVQTQTQCFGMRSDRGELSTTTTANSTDSHGHFMNENRTMATKNLEQCPNYNKTRAIASVAEAQEASRQNRPALLPLALRSETTGTGQVSEVNSYSSHSQPRSTTPSVTRQSFESHESRVDERTSCNAKGHNPGNNLKYETPLFTSLDNVDHSRENVWRPW